MVRSTVGEVLVPARQATEDRSSGYDVLHQNSILNEWFERGSYLCLKSRLSFTEDFMRRIGPGQSTSDQVRNCDLTLFGDRCLAKCSKTRVGKPFLPINPIMLPVWLRRPSTAHFLIRLHGPVPTRMTYQTGLRCQPRRRKEVDQNGFPQISARFLSRSEEHTSELQSRQYLVCRLLL